MSVSELSMPVPGRVALALTESLPELAAGPKDSVLRSVDGAEVRPELLWSPPALSRYEWLKPFLEVPEDASPPLAMTPPSEDAVGSYGADAVSWIEETQRIKLRWWQRLAVTRQLEHREDGSLCYRTLVESCPRRAGKSVRIRGMALWRMHSADLFGEVQTVVHTGADVAICREIQRGAWRWSEEVAGWVVSRANGKEAIETPDGDRWLVRAQGAVYGYDVCLGVVDEGWNVAPDTVSEGLEPAILERQSPQLHLTSTAHRRATSLMRTALSHALSTADPETLLLLWGAPSGSDPSDPAVWRAASPYWSEDRRRMIAAKYEKALAGENDPELDDPNPMRGFEAQYLNVWRLREDSKDPAISPDKWADCLDAGTLDEVKSRVALCLDVSLDGQHATLVAAAVLPDGRVRVEVVAAWDGPGCTRELRKELPGHVSRVKPRVVGWLPNGPGAALAADLADRKNSSGRRVAWPPAGVSVEEIRSEVTSVCMGLAEQVQSGQIAHSDDPLLNAHIAGAEKLHQGDAWRFTRKGAGQCDATYAAAGAVHLARTLPPPVGKPRLIVAGKS